MDRNAGPPQPKKNFSRKWPETASHVCVRQTHHQSCYYQLVQAHEPSDAGGAEWASHQTFRSVMALLVFTNTERKNEMMQTSIVQLLELHTGLRDCIFQIFLPKNLIQCEKARENTIKIHKLHYNIEPYL